MSGAKVISQTTLIGYCERLSSMNEVLHLIRKEYRPDHSKVLPLKAPLNTLRETLLTVKSDILKVIKQGAVPTDYRTNLDLSVGHIQDLVKSLNSLQEDIQTYEKSLSYNQRTDNIDLYDKRKTKGYNF